MKFPVNIGLQNNSGLFQIELEREAPEHHELHDFPALAAIIAGVSGREEGFCGTCAQLSQLY